MAWSYDLSTAPADREKVRLLIGDTSSGDQLLQDEEIDWQLSQHGGILYTASACAEDVAAKFTRKPNISEGGFRVDAAAQSQAYEKLAKRLKRQASMGANPYAGGISVSDKQTQEADTDRVIPSFRRDMFAHNASSSG